MRSLRRAGRVLLTCVLTCVFLLVSLIPGRVPPAYAAVAPPLPIAEDPLGQEPEQQIPEISINVDVRDGHPSVRVVNIWGPGRVPMVFRSYTNTQSRTEMGPPDPDTGTPSPIPNSGPFRFQFNHHLDVLGADVLEADGNRSSFRYSHDRLNADGTQLWQVYVKDIGTYATMEMHYNYVAPPPPPPPDCPPCPGGDRKPSPTGATSTSPKPKSSAPAKPQPIKRQPRVLSQAQAAPANYVWDGSHVVYLPKAGVRRFQNSQIIEDRDANGNATTFTYTTFVGGIGQYLATVTDPVGRQTRYGYEPAYQVCTVWGTENFPGCREWKWVYRVRSATDPYGRSATYTYDANTLKMTSVTNAAGRITNYGYNPTGGLLETVTNARGFVATFLWTSGPDGTPRVARVTAPDGTATNYAYTHEAVAPYRVIRTVVTNARGHASAYDVSDGNVVRATDPLGNATQYAYDARRNVTQVTDARGIATTYAYNTRNKVTQIVRAAGILNLTTTLSWDGNDNLLSVTNPRGIRTDYTYSATHNLTSVRRAVGTADESLTQYAYTAWGGVSFVTDPRGSVTSYAYTLRRQLQTISPPAGAATTFGYDAFDDQTSMTNGNARTWSTIYNASRQVTSVTDPLGNRISYEYDANGNQTRVLDAKLQATSFAYNSRDRLISITDPLNGVTGYNNDPEGNLIRITNARNLATSFAYDAVNRLTQVTDVLGQITTYTYDASGNRISMRDRRGATHTYTYDQVSRLTQVSAGGSTISYTYDANGNRLTMVDSTGTTSYAYDTLDRLTRTTYPPGRAVQVAYDRAGNRTSLTYPGGAVSMSYAYDAASRLTTITQGTLQWTFTYDGAGNRTQLTFPNGARTQYAYLANNWLSSISHLNLGGGSILGFSYAYDASGNRISQVDPSGTTTFTYDALNRLTQAAYPGGYGTWGWAYDAIGNRTSQTAPGGTAIYTYDANNRLTSGGGISYTYDASGNLTNTSAGQTFSYDVFNRMTQAVSSGGTASYTYNGDGLKVRRIGPDGQINYFYDGIRPIWETDGAGAMTAQLDRDIFGNLLSRAEPNGARRYLHADGLGSTVVLSDEAGMFAATMFYDAWGQARSTSGTGHGKYRFTGAELDTASGLYHMGARFYDPTIGRWLSEDPLQPGVITLPMMDERIFNPLSLNFYAYAALNPLSYVDPSGLEAQKKTFAEIVLEWVRSFGKEKALSLAREAWQALGQIIDALAEADSYGDVNIAAVVFAGLTGGVIHDKNNRIYAYFGVAVGLQGGATFTVGLHGVTPGWNIAVSGTFPSGLGLQLGTALRCFSTCNYREYGLATPVPGASFAIFYVWRLR